MIVPENPPEIPTSGTPAPSKATRNQRLRWWAHLIIIGSYPLIVGVLSLIRAAPQAPALARDASGLLRACAFQLTIFALIFGLGWMASRASSNNLLLKWQPGPLVIPLGIAYSVGLRLALAMIAVFVITLLLLTQVIRVEDLPHLAQNNRPNVQALVDVPALRHDPFYFWLNLTLVSFLVAGLREELWRAAVLAGLRVLWPDWFGSQQGSIAAVGVAAAIFGFGHVAQGPVAIAAAGLLGFGLGTIMVMHRSIWPAVIAHGLFDATTFAALPWLFERLPQLR